MRRQSVETALCFSLSECSPDNCTFFKFQLRAVLATVKGLVIILAIPGDPDRELAPVDSVHDHLLQQRDLPRAVGQYEIWGSQEARVLLQKVGAGVVNVVLKGASFGCRI